MTLVIPTVDIEWAKALLEGGEYEAAERSYKVAVHSLIAGLLSPSSLASPSFPELMADVFGANNPDSTALGLGPEGDEAIQSAIAIGHMSSVKNAMANLAGGQWGAAQFIWIPRAVEFGLGEELRSAFAGLVAEDVPLEERVDTFRKDLYAVEVALKERGGFMANWNLIPVSMNFVGMLLGAFDYERYIFYAAKKLRAAMNDWGVEWPKGTAGEKYGVICDFAAEVREAFQAAGVPVKDILDVQGIIWVRGLQKQEAAPKAPETEPLVPAAASAVGIDHDEVARDLADETYWDYDRALALVKKADRWGQLLFQGPPGTGKTFVAKKLAELMAGDEEGRVEAVQFHPSYAYEDFIEGIRPKVTTDNKTLLYEIKPGIFMDLVSRAIQYPEEPFFLVLDEMNRANLPRVFGELLFGLEYRGEKNGFTLPYSGVRVWVPENITIIGAMNTADRSIALVDAAIRRRFRHVEFPPDLDVLRGWLEDHGLSRLAQGAAGRLGRLNQELEQSLDKDRLVGHTYLMREDLAEAGYETVWDEDIGPVLSEHLYNRPEEVARLRDVFLS